MKIIVDLDKTEEPSWTTLEGDEGLDVEVLMVSETRPTLHVTRRHALWLAERDSPKEGEPTGEVNGVAQWRWELAVPAGELSLVQSRVLRLTAGAKTRAIHVVKAWSLRAGAFFFFASIVASLLWMSTFLSTLVINKSYSGEMQWLAGSAVHAPLALLAFLRGIFAKPVGPRALWLVQMPEFAFVGGAALVIASVIVPPFTFTQIRNGIRDGLYYQAGEVVTLKKDEIITEVRARRPSLDDIRERLHNVGRADVEGCCVYWPGSPLGLPCGQYPKEQTSCTPDPELGKGEPRDVRWVQRYVIGCSARPWRGFQRPMLRDHALDTRGQVLSSARESGEDLFLDINADTCKPPDTAAMVLDAGRLMKELGKPMSGAGEVKLLYGERAALDALKRDPELVMKAYLPQHTGARTARFKAPKESSARLTIANKSGSAGPIVAFWRPGQDRLSVALGSNDAPLALDAPAVAGEESVLCPKGQTDDRGLDVWLLPLRGTTLNLLWAKSEAGVELSSWARLKPSVDQAVPAAICLAQRADNAMKVHALTLGLSGKTLGTIQDELRFPSEIAGPNVTVEIGAAAEDKVESLFGKATCQPLGVQAPTGYRITKLKGAGELNRISGLKGAEKQGPPALWANGTSAPWVCVAEGFEGPYNVKVSMSEGSRTTEEDGKLQCDKESCSLILSSRTTMVRCCVRLVGGRLERTACCPAPQSLDNLPAYSREARELGCSGLCP